MTEDKSSRGKKDPLANNSFLSDRKCVIIETQGDEVTAEDFGLASTQ
jgi:hypothetical protein